MRGPLRNLRLSDWKGQILVPLVQLAVQLQDFAAEVSKFHIYPVNLTWCNVKNYPQEERKRMTTVMH